MQIKSSLLEQMVRGNNWLWALFTMPSIWRDRSGCLVHIHRPRHKLHPFPRGYTTLICIHLRNLISGTEHHLTSPLAIPLIMGKLHREKKDKKINSMQVHRNFPSSKAHTHAYTHAHTHARAPSLHYAAHACVLLYPVWGMAHTSTSSFSSVGSYINHSTHFSFVCLSWRKVHGGHIITHSLFPV